MNKRTLLSLLAGIVVSAGIVYAQKPNPHVVLHNPAKFDSGEEELDQSPGQEVADEHRPLLNLPRQSQSNNRPDEALQGSSGLVVNTVNGAGFDGVPVDPLHAVAPPDTNMAVGPNHIIQWVNLRFAIYDKTGTILSGYPKNGNAFWSGFGGPCETQNSGDPIIQYDAVADRWIASQFTTSGPPYYQCFAVSKTSDPTGAYNRYAYAFTSAFPDYPKITVWKNAYFASYNLFASTAGGWIGPHICAYDRAAMLAGTNAVEECFDVTGGNYGSLLPSDLDGGSAFAPPTNTGYFMDYGTNALALWRFTPDFVTPANATLVGPISLPAAAFAPACGGGTCIPQPSGQKLDSLADRLMYRLAYRNFGTYEAMVVNQSVTAGTSVGVRWYEIRDPLTNPTIYQQGTFAPDATYRWMGSIAMDKVGNIAVGYSGSSSSLVPSIRYTGRETTDPLGTLQGEQTIITSGGSQTGGLSRWGDYAAMRIDPADDCTFWFTSEYIPSNGSFNWRTRIASFKFNSCAGPVPDFSIGATPSSQTVNPGTSTTYAVSTTALNGYGGTIGLSVTGLPAGATPSFVPASITGTGGSQLTITAAAGITPGMYPLTITGLDGTLTHSTPVTLTVTTPDFTVDASPSSRTVIQGSGTTYGVTIGSLNGFTSGVALTVSSGLPTGATASFSPNPVAGGSGPSTLSVSTMASTPSGTYTLTIRGTSGALAHTTTVTLVVQSQAQSSFSLTSTPTSRTITARQSTTYAIAVVPVNGFNSAVTFSVSGLPSKTSATFSSSSSTTGTTLTVKTNPTTPKVTGATLTITGTGGGLTRTVQVTLTIQ